MSPPALETRGLSKSFGALTVANAIDFRLERGARHALIGPNGAGKTSFVNLVTGALQPSAGQILLDGEDVTAFSQPARVKRGLARTFQITQLFRGLSVLENVTLAVCERRGVGGDPWRPAGRHRAAIEEAFALLERMGLANHARQPVATLPYGRQRLIEIALALALGPKVLLLDEPAAGVPSGETVRIIEAIEKSRARHRRADHRSRHGSGLPPGPTDHGAGAGQRAGRRAACGDQRRPTGASGLSRRASAGVSEPEGLLVEGVSAGYGETIVIEGIALHLPPGGTLALLGRNGVGKTTLLATIIGHTRLHTGTIRYLGREIGAFPVFRRARLGIGFVPQEREIFPSLSVAENLLVAARPGRWSMARVYDFFPALAERRQHRGNQLSGGEQQMLAIGRALIGNPSLLLMDEPLEGLAPVIVDAVLAGLDRLKREDELALLLVEQHARLALEFAQHAIVLDRGHIVFAGASRDLLDAPDRLEALMGVAAPAERD